MASIQFILATFQDEASAKAELDKLKAARKEGLSGLHAAAEVQKEASGKVHTKELAEFTAGEGAIGGAILGVVLTAVTGGVALLVGAAFAAIGGLMGKITDTGIPNQQLADLGKKLEPGTSAVVAVVDQRWVGSVSEMLKAAGGDVQSIDVPPELVGKIKGSAGASAEENAAMQMSMGSENTIGTGNASAAAADAMKGNVDTEIE